jgi:LacI family transcriptional regulator
VSVKRAATIDDVAAAAGVSTATVSRFLNGTQPVGEATAARVRAAAERLSYVPQAAARQLAQGRTHSLGMLLPDVSDDFFAPLLRSITDSATEHGYTLLIGIRPSGHERPLPLGKQNTDGLLVFDQSLSDAELHRLHAVHFPLVVLYRSPPPGVDVPCILVENRAGARAATEHLITHHGRRRIAFLRGPEGNEDSAQREDGYRDALAAHAIPFDPALVGVGAFRERVARDTVTGWLAANVSFDAVFAGDDGSASGALAALRQAGVAVPQEVALVGFDDAARARYLDPPLTTVRAPGAAVGRAAVHQLLRQIAGDDADLRTVLPTELVLRRSCGCPGNDQSQNLDDDPLSAGSGYGH